MLTHHQSKVQCTNDCSDIASSEGESTVREKVFQVSPRTPQERKTVTKATELEEAVPIMQTHLPKLHRLPKVKSAANFRDLSTMTGESANACERKVFMRHTPNAVIRNLPNQNISVPNTGKKKSQ